MPPADRFGPAALADPAEHAFAITPNDTTDLSYVTRAIWVGGAGNLNVVMLSGATVLFSGIAAGTLMRVRASRVMATSTTATLLVGMV